MADLQPTIPSNRRPSDLEETIQASLNQSEMGSQATEEHEALKDKIDDAVPKGVKKADASSGGRVVVAETGDLRKLAEEKGRS